MSLPKKTATEVQNLTWALADEVITPPKVKRLEKLLLAEPEARRLYVECMQLQADLYLFFNPDRAKITVPLPTAEKARTKKTPTTPVLKNFPTGGAGSTHAGV